MPTDTETAALILRQLGGSGRLGAMIGAKHFVNHGDALSFKFARPKHAKNLPNYCKITHNGFDTYDVAFAYVRKFDMKCEQDFANVEVAQLRGLFERVTGLYLSL